MRGNITRRAKASWRIKFDIGHDVSVTGKRKYHTETVRGTKADAVTAISKRLAERGEGQLVQRTSITVAEYAEHWLSAIARVTQNSSESISCRTLAPSSCRS